MYKMQDNNYNKILRELFDKPTYRFHIRELARATKLNPNTIINITNKLEKEGIVEKQSKKHLVEVSLDLEKEKTIQKKKLFNLSRIYDSGLVNFLIDKYSHPKSITLLGSYSRGEDIERSDIDIAVNTIKKEIVDLTSFEKILKRKIHLLILPKKISEEFFNNLINGVVLYGAIKNDII